MIKNLKFNIQNLKLSRINSAFTLVEILIVLVIMGILASISIPNFISYQQNIKLTDSANLLDADLYEAFSNARSEPLVYVIEGSSSDGYNQSYNIYSCKPNINPCVPIKEKKKLRPGIIISKIEFEKDGNGTEFDNFQIRFWAPHGDITWHDDIDNVNYNKNNSEYSELDKEVLKITLQVISNTEKFKRIKIYKNSGFIEVLD